MLRDDIDLSHAKDSSENPLFFDFGIGHTKDFTSQHHNVINGVNFVNDRLDLATNISTIKSFGFGFLVGLPPDCCTIGLVKAVAALLKLIVGRKKQDSPGQYFEDIHTPDVHSGIIRQ